VNRPPGWVDKQMRTLVRFVEVYCRAHHQPKGAARQGGKTVCAECRGLLDYARGRLACCPLDPKPKCKNCHIHCYQPKYRSRVKEVMKFSGMHFVKRGRLDWLVKYFLSG